MFSLRTHLLISGGLFGFILLMAIVGNAIQAAGIIKHPEALQTPMKIIFFPVFLAFAYSMVPSMIKLFLAGQGAIGNAEKAPLRFLEAHQVGVIWGFWMVWTGCLAVAMPTMIRSGFFSNLGDQANNPSSSSDSEIAREIARMPVQGILVATPGMTIQEMIHGSTLKIDQGPNPAVPTKPVYAGGAIFDFHVAATGIEFHRCRYYYMSTYTRDPARIEAINIGTASAKMSRAQLESANAELRAASRPMDG
jgi:hypothetical protein